MDDKTEELRDIFVEVTDEQTVTETQEEGRGTLLDDDGDLDERLTEVITAMRERYEFSTDLSTRDLRRLVVGFHDGASDAELARRLDVDRETAVRARLELHLLRDRDTDAPFDLDAFRDRLDGDDGDPIAALADEFDVAPSTLRRYRRVLRARDRSLRANERYRDAFREVLSDVDLGERLVDPAREDGLEAATEDIETDVQF